MLWRWYWLWSRWQALWNLCGQEPSLVDSVVAVIEDDWSLVLVDSTLDIKALLGVVSQVLVLSTEEGHLLVNFLLELSDDCGSVDLEALSQLVGDGEVLVSESSDGVSSSVEDEPLLLILGVVVSDSQSELALRDWFIIVEGSESGHS